MSRKRKRYRKDSPGVTKVRLFHPEDHKEFKVSLDPVQFEYVRKMADDLGMSMSEVGRTALHLLDTIRRCDDAGIPNFFDEGDSLSSIGEVFPPILGPKRKALR